VPPLPFQKLKLVIERELGGPIENFYSSFDTEALASASIAQVHAARTLEGDDVVVKIQKPDVAKQLTSDLEILQMIAEALEATVPELRPFKPKNIAREFKRSILAELDFKQEASNMKRYRDNFATTHFLVIPKVYPALSTYEVLTQERLRGVKLNDLAAVRALGVDTRELLRQGMECFYKSIMVDGFFHGDPHGGNILVLPDGRMGLLDFGSMGWLSIKARHAIINMFMAMLTEDYDALVWEYLLLSPPSSGSRSSAKLEAIQDEVAQLFTPYHGLPLKEIPAGRILMQGTTAAFKHQIPLPRDLVLVFKAIMTLEGIGRMLDPDFDLVTAATRFSGMLLKERYDPKRMLKEFAFVARDTMRFLQTAPRQISETLRQIESGELKITTEIADFEKLTKAKVTAASKLSFAIASVGWLASSLFILNERYLPSTVCWVLVGIGIAANGWAIFKNFRA
jgi:ubiquinone biosynthesis protein